MKAETLRDPHVAIMLRLRDGDDRALNELMDVYGRRVVAVAYRFLQNATEAQDAAQETFLRVYRARRGYRPGARLAPWIFAITHRVCLNLLRHRRRHPAEHLEAAAHPGQPGRLAETIADPRADGAAETLEHQETREQVRQAVASLPEVERLALILDHWEGLSLREIGEVLQRTPGAIKSILFRARAKLRVRLAACVQSGDKE